jgi:hypothetical protein
MILMPGPFAAEQQSGNLKTGQLRLSSMLSHGATHQALDNAGLTRRIV